MTPKLFRFDVTDALPAEVCGGERLSIAAWVFLPEDLTRLPERPTVMTFLNGGTYDKRYFHVQIPGRSGYSMAEHLARLGHIVVLPDHLGIGDSSRAPVQATVTREVAAAANHAAMLQLYAQLRAGTLDASLPALPDFVKLGGGHSMGGCQLITQQARHRTYDRIAVLGYTALAVHLYFNGQHLRADTLPKQEAEDYAVLSRAPLRDSFHWDDVPADVMAADDALVVPVPHVLGSQAATGGIVTQDAATIDVPVFICLGEKDVSPNPHGEPALYPSSTDITLQILPRSGHCHSFASTRTILFDRIHHWNLSIPA